MVTLLEEEEEEGRAAPSALKGSGVPGALCRYPHDLLRMRQTQRCFSLEDFDVAKRPIGQGRFGEPAPSAPARAARGEERAVRVATTRPAFPRPCAAGTVLRVREKRSRRILVMKAIAKSAIVEEGIKPQLQREIEVHCRLVHPNIVRMYAYFTDAEKVYILMEWANGGNLYEKLQSSVGKV